MSAGPGQPGGWGVPRDSASEGVESEVEEEGEELDGAPWSSWDAVGEDESVEEESEPASNRDHKTLSRLMVLLRVTEAETAEVEEAMFRDHDLNYGLEQAQKWGIEFLEGARSRGEPSPRELAQHDEVELKTAGGLEQLASNRFRERALKRLSPDRVAAVCTPLLESWCSRIPGRLDRVNREEFVRAVAAVDSFSRSGVPVIVDDDFEPCDEPGRLSKSARQAPAAVEAHLYKQRVLGMGILLTEASLQSIVDRNEMTNGIALQKEKLRGRLTTNCSGNAARRGKFLNSKGAKKKAIAEWGELKLPTIELIILDIIEIADEHGQDEVVALKADVDTAYPQCSFDPKKVQWMTSRAPSGLVYCSLHCNFGWGPMGFAFNMISIVVVSVVTAIAFGLVRMYVDDLITITTKKHCRRDRELASMVLDSLMGEGSDSVAKQGSTEDNNRREIVILGWLICLSTWTVDVAQYNRVKTLYTFWTLDLESVVSFKTMQALCSLAQRYAMVFRELGVLMGDLWCMLAERKKSERGVKLSSRAKMVIILWRAYLVRSEVMLMRGEATGRSLSTFRKSRARYIVEFDGSLKGVGVRVFSHCSEGERVIFNFGLATLDNLGGDSSYQNSLETIGGVLGILLAGLLGAKHATVHLRGDSKVALAWLSGGKSGFRSIHAQGALMAAVIVLEQCDIVVEEETTLLTSKQNHVCDCMSRLGAVSAEELQAVPMVWGGVGGVTRRLADLCNPLRWPDSEEGIVGRMMDIKWVVRACLEGVTV